MMNLTYPGGTLVQEEISGAGDDDIDLSPGAGKRWDFVLGRVQLEAAAEAGTRVIRLQVYDSSNNLLVEYPSSPDITVVDVSLTRTLNLSKNVDIPTSAGVWDYHEGIGELLLQDGMYLRITIANGLAADTVSGYILFREFGL